MEHAAMVTAVIEPPDGPSERAILHRELLTLPKDDLYVLSDDAGNVISASSDWRPSEQLPERSQTFSISRVHGHRYRIFIERKVLSR